MSQAEATWTRERMGSFPYDPSYRCLWPWRCPAGGESREWYDLTSLILTLPGQRLLQEIRGREQDRATASRLSQDLQAALQVSSSTAVCPSLSARPPCLCQAPGLPGPAAPTDHQPAVLSSLPRTTSCRQKPTAAPWVPPRQARPPRGPEWLPCRRASRPR